MSSDDLQGRRQGLKNEIKVEVGWDGMDAYGVGSEAGPVLGRVSSLLELLTSKRCGNLIWPSAQDMFSFRSGETGSSTGRHRHRIHGRGG